MKIDYVKLGITSPNMKIIIYWEVDNCSGSTICEAWRGQYELEQLEKAGYLIIEIAIV